MAYTYDGFVTAANKAGVMKQFSDDDLKLAQQYPEFGYSMMSLIRDQNNATTTEQKLLAAEAADQLRGSYSTRGNTGTGDYDSKINSLLKQSANYGSFNYGRQPDYNKLLDEVANPGSFSYDLESDPVWVAYQKQYQREGQRAQANTLAQVSAATGGRPSSYAVTAAQQAGDYYNAQMTDKIPELYQTAYQRYLNDLGVKQDALAALQSDRDTAYGEWMDGFNMLQTNLGNYQGQSNTAYQRYLDRINQQIQAEQLAYQKIQDSIANNQWQQQFDYQKDLDGLELEAQEAKAQEANRLAAAQLMAEAGDYSRLAEIYGLSASELAALKGANSDPDPTVPGNPLLDMITDAAGDAPVSGDFERAVKVGSTLQPYKDLTASAGNAHSAALYNAATSNKYENILNSMLTENTVDSPASEDSVSNIPSNYAEAVQRMRTLGMDNDIVAGLLSQEDWQKAKTAGSSSAAAYDSYAEYLEAYMGWAEFANKYPTKASKLYSGVGLSGAGIRGTSMQMQ